jgi:hypothetical protein
MQRGISTTMPSIPGAPRKLGVLLTALGFAACSAHAGTAFFTPIGPTSVPVGTQIEFSVTIQAGGTFDLARVFVGSPDATDLDFITDTAWNTAFSAGTSTLLYDEPGPPSHAENVLLEGNIVGSGTTGPNLLAGVLKIDTTGMAPGSYSASLLTSESYTASISESGQPVDLLGSLNYTLTPEPGTLLLLAVGGVSLLRRKP